NTLLLELLDSHRPAAAATYHADVWRGRLQQVGQHRHIERDAARHGGDVRPAVDRDGAGDFGGRDGVAGGGVGQLLRVAHIGAVVGGQHAEAQPVGQFRERLPDMSAADHQYGGIRHDRLQKNIKLAAAYTGVAPRRVDHLVVQVIRLPGFEKLKRALDDAVFHLAATDGAFDAAVGVDEHLAPRVARHRSAVPRDGRQHNALPALFGIQDGLVDLNVGHELLLDSSRFAGIGG